MAYKRLASLLFAGLLAALSSACALETVDTTTMGGDGDGDGDGDVDLNGEEDLLCSALLHVTGSLAPSGPTPGPEEGCVPYGTWTVNVEVMDPGDCTEVPVAETYTYEVTPLPDEGGYEYEWVDDPTDENVHFKISEGGPGDCEGNFEHFTPDGLNYVLLKPHERDLVLEGQGAYELWGDSQI